MKTWPLGEFLATLAAVLVASPAVSAPDPERGPHDSEPRSCGDAVRSWDWKANGYAVAKTSKVAQRAAVADATDYACNVSQPYLDEHRLKCGASCIIGAESRDCDRRKAPGCITGIYSDNPGMWTFACRKYRGKADPKLAATCTKDNARTFPGYALCEVHTRATRTLSCGAKPEER